jgi:hypothetical protein
MLKTIYITIIFYEEFCTQIIIYNVIYSEQPIIGYKFVRYNPDCLNQVLT